MKLISAFVGGQLLLAAAVIANPITYAAKNIVVARSPAPVADARPGCIKERGEENEADFNFCYLKLKRDAELAAETATVQAVMYERAVTVRKKLQQGAIVAREVLPGYIKERDDDDEDDVNFFCLKLKRDAEAAASIAADAYTSYAEMLAYRKL